MGFFSRLFNTDVLPSASEAREKKYYVSRREVILIIRKSISKGVHECRVSGYITAELKKELLELGYYVETFIFSSGAETMISWK